MNSNNVKSYVIANVEAWPTYEQYKGKSAWREPEIPGALVVPQNETVKGYCDEPCPLYAATNMSLQAVIDYMLDKFGVKDVNDLGQGDYHRGRGIMWAQMFISQLKSGTFNFAFVKDGIAAIDAKFFDHEWLESLRELDEVNNLLCKDKEKYSIFNRLKKFVQDKCEELGFNWLDRASTDINFYQPIPISENDKVKYGLQPWWTEVLGYHATTKGTWIGEEWFNLKCDLEIWKLYEISRQSCGDNISWWKFYELSLKFIKGEMSDPAEADDYFRACSMSQWPREREFAEAWKKAPYRRLWKNWFELLAEQYRKDLR